jgi:SH3-like domain-containing protein
MSPTIDRFSGRPGLLAATLAFLGAFAAFALTPAAAQQTGPSGLALPRFVSLKSDRVNVRQGPSRDHQVVWVFTRAGLPVEITAEFENWRRIRDADGSEGWVQQGLLSGRRTALIAPWSRDRVFELRGRANASADVRARLEPGVLANVRNCTGSWCRVVVGDVDGFIQQDALWGAYPNERID